MMSHLKHIALVLVIAGIVVAGWLVWKHATESKTINSYRECVDAGNPIQEMYPQVCVTKDGQRFVTPGAQSSQPPNEGPLPAQ
jgi:hypothetical protein